MSGRDLVGAFGDFKAPSEKALDRGGDVKEDSVGMGRENLKHGDRQLSSFRFMVRDALVCLAIPESCTRQMRNAAWTDPGARLWAQWGPLLRET